MSDFSEHRRSERIKFTELPLVFSLILDEPLQTKHPLRLEALNISLHGLKFQANYRIPLFAELKVQFFQKKHSGHKPLLLLAKVVRLEEVDRGLSEKIYGIAVNFEHQEKSIQQLEDLFQS